MTAYRPRARRTATLATTVAAAALTAGLLTACDPTNTSNSLDCFQNWDTISDSLRAIHEAGADAAKDPSRTDESITTINKNLDKIDADSDDSKVGKAVDNLDKAISDYNRSILNGDTNPDSSRIDEAADKLKNVCTS
jgi:hypothetical protein